MSVECSVCDSTDISDNNFCNDCGSVVCKVCGNQGEEEWDEPKKDGDEWVTYCKGCGTEARTDHEIVL
jgi:hypothetical protein